MAAMEEPKRYTIPDWFPRNPQLDGQAEESETKREWNKYLLIPKGEQRKAYMAKLKDRYRAMWTPDETSLIHGPQGEPTPQPNSEEPPVSWRTHELPPETLPEPSRKRALFLDEEEQPGTAQASTHYTAKQVEMAKFIRMSMELMARSNNCTILDMRKAYEYWLSGKCANHK